MPHLGHFSIRQKAAAIGLGTVALFGLGSIGNAYIHRSQDQKTTVGPSKSTVDQQSKSRQPVAKSSSKKRPAYGSINLNTANEPELCKLPGVGPSTAKRILEYRGAHGAFQSIDELDNVKGIGPKKLAEVRPYCRL